MLSFYQLQDLCRVLNNFALHVVEIETCVETKITSILTHPYRFHFHLYQSPSVSVPLPPIPAKINSISASDFHPQSTSAYLLFNTHYYTYMTQKFLLQINQPPKIEFTWWTLFYSLFWENNCYWIKKSTIWSMKVKSHLAFHSSDGWKLRVLHGSGSSKSHAGLGTNGCLLSGRTAAKSRSDRCGSPAGPGVKLYSRFHGIAAMSLHVAAIGNFLHHDVPWRAGYQKRWGLQV